MTTLDEATSRLGEFLSDSRKAVFFGGAGISTESGIPDFRSSTGLYTTASGEGWPPEFLLSHTCYRDYPRDFFSFYRDSMLYPDAKPNAAHLALARLEDLGVLSAVVTQNIDGLHQAAGSKVVHELHGNVHRNYCDRCFTRYGLDVILESDGVPTCECGGVIKPDVVLYEEPLDSDVIEAAVEAISEADTLIVGGTSLNVHPAAGLVRYYRGRQLVLINKSETMFDRNANLVIHDSLGKVLSEALLKVEANRS